MARVLVSVPDQVARVLRVISQDIVDLSSGEGTKRLRVEVVGPAVEASSSELVQIVCVEGRQEGGINNVLQVVRLPMVQLNHPSCKETRT